MLLLTHKDKNATNFHIYLMRWIRCFYWAPILSDYENSYVEAVSHWEFFVQWLLFLGKYKENFENGGEFYGEVFQVERKWN